MQPNSVAQIPTSYSNYQPSVPISLYRELSSELQLTQAKLDALQLQNEQLARQNQLLIQEFAGLAKSSQQMQEAIVRSGQQMQDAISQSSQKLQEVISPVSIRASAKKTEAVTKSKLEKQPNNAVQRMQEVVAQSRPSSPIPPMPPMPQVATQPLSAAMPQQIAQPISQDVAQAVAQAVAQRLTPEAAPPVQMPSFDSPSPAIPKLSTHQEEIKKTVALTSSPSSSVTGWWLFLTIVIIVGTSFGAGYFLMRPFASNSK